MADVRAFRGIRYAYRALEDVTCPPYDIIGDEERAALATRDPFNVVRLELPRDGTDVYATAGEALRRWLREGILAREGAPAFYLYEMRFTANGREHSVLGCVGSVALEPFERGVVLPHEETLSAAKADRFQLMQATKCNISQIYSLYFDDERRTADFLRELADREPDAAFTDGGVTHRLWVVTDEAACARITRDFEDRKLYIADGHHRYETALNYREWLRGRRENDPAAGSCMMMLVDIQNPGLVVFPFHRIVRGLQGFSLPLLLTSLRQDFAAEPARDAQDAMRRLEAGRADGHKVFALYTGGRFQMLTLRDITAMDEALPDASPALKGLDVSVLHKLILEKHLGIDAAAMAGGQNLRYTRLAEEALSAVDSGEAELAFFLNPTRVAEIAAVAGAGEKMPQKSSYFYPKLTTGLVMHPLWM